jgi:hypothetical protein
MTFCKYTTVISDNGEYRHTCQREGCGQSQVSASPRLRTLCRVQKAKPLRKSIKNDVQAMPSWMTRAKTFVSAEARWIAAGRPMRSDDQMAEIFAICESCEFFVGRVNGGEGVCRLCGCNLKRIGGILNKIRMATETCPANPPRWKAEATVLDQRSHNRVRL